MGVGGNLGRPISLFLIELKYKNQSKNMYHETFMTGKKLVKNISKEPLFTLLAKIGVMTFKQWICVMHG